MVNSHFWAGFLLAPLAAAPALDTPAALLHRAGSTSDDHERLAILRQLRSHPDLDDALKKDMDPLIANVELWCGTDLCFFNYGRDHFKEDIAETSPLYPLHAFYRARMKTWSAFEYGGILNKEEWHGEANRLMEVVKAAYPENRIARMYLGETFPAPPLTPAPEGIPEWALLQREGLERLADIIHWWIDHRQQPNGLYGGGAGDDCEMWRWWVPILVAFKDEKVEAAQARLSRAILDDPHMAPGYWTHKGLDDVEHSSEPLSDTLAPMMLIDPDNPEWSRRALRIAELMETLWTGINQRGFLQFKSIYFDGEKVDPDPVRSFDAAYDARAVFPALILWLRTGDPKLTALFSRWMDAWVDITAREDSGKPAGVMPAFIHWPDGEVKGPKGDWRTVGFYHEPLYDWPSSLPAIAKTLLLAHHMTGDPKYMEPMRSMVALGHLAVVEDALVKHRVLTGSSEFESILLEKANPYTRYRLSGDRAPMLERLRENAAALGHNFEGFTLEPRFTDRVLHFPRRFDRSTLSGKLPDPQLLYSMATGDPGDVQYFPMNAVRWLTAPRDLAVLVTDAGTDRLEVELVNFAPSERNLRAELHLLAPGNYEVIPDGAVRTHLRVESGAARLDLHLPPGRLVRLSVHPAP
ncbi:MAG: hypothetical protein GHCLOJNM_01605 [bacterium]|nr:hypothetical protein [bacterium]